MRDMNAREKLTDFVIRWTMAAGAPRSHVEKVMTELLGQLLDDHRDEVLASAATYIRETGDVDASAIADVLDPAVDTVGFVRFGRGTA